MARQDDALQIALTDIEVSDVTGAPYRDFRLIELQRDRNALGAFTATALRLPRAFRWRPIDYVEIMAVVDGRGRKAENLGPDGPQSFLLSRGDVFLVRSGTEHIIEPAGPQG